jgi:hypothetical protein
MSKSIPSRDNHRGEEVTGIPQTALMSGAQAKDRVHWVGAWTPRNLFPHLFHSSRASSPRTPLHKDRVVRVNLLFSSVPNGPLTHLHAHISAFSLLLHKDFSCQLYLYSMTVVLWCANLICVHSSLSSYRRTSGVAC